MFRAPAIAVLASLSFLFLTAMSNMAVHGLVAPNLYVNSNNQFSINPPSGWSVDSSGANGTAVILNGPVTSGFTININVEVRTTSLNLTDYVTQEKSQLAASLTNYQLVSEVSTTIGGVAAYQLVNTFTQGSYNIEDQQDILVQNQKAYIITSTALQSNYGVYQTLFDQSVQTFQLTGPTFPWLFVIVGGAVVAAIVVGLTVFFVRRKRRASVP